MDAWIYKVIIIFLILSITLFFGLLPIRVVAFLRRQEWRNLHASGENQQQVPTSKARQILGYLNCFAGGVFLGTCLLHLFPEVKEKYESVMSSAGLKIKFPLSEMIISCGFFLVMLIEHGAMSLKQRQRSHHHHPDDDHGQSNAGHTDHQEQHSHNIEDQHSDPDEEQPMLAAGSSHYGTMAGESQESIKPGGHPGDDEMIVGYETLGNSYTSQHECDGQSPHHHHPGQTHDETVHIHGIRSLVLLLALSLHTLFEGLALGLETEESKLWSLFGAVSIHKALIAFTMGLQFTDTFQQSRVLCYMLIFSVVSPVGIAVGTIITSVNQSLALNVTAMVLEGVATGTFLYVTFFEVLQKELGLEEHSVSKVLVIIVGFDIIALTTLFGN